MSLFPTFSLDRDVIHWEDYLLKLTPVENHQGVWFKREDFFAPLGLGGLSGSKCRQLIWYMDRYREGKTHVLSGASLQSPQLLMSAIIGAHYDLPSRLVVYSKPETVMRHVSPRIAAGFGACFEYASGPYNPILQRRVAELTVPTSLVVHYGITVDHRNYPVKDILDFHTIGAEQVRNVPEEVTTLIMPTGSCNSLCSVILGLSKYPNNISTLVAMEIGPDKRDWLWERLGVLGIRREDLPFKVKYVTLHGDYSKYTDHFKESFDGIKFHPVYEAKMWRWLEEHGGIERDGKTLFWIVGGEPDVKVMEPFFYENQSNEEMDRGYNQDRI